MAQDMGLQLTHAMAYWQDRMQIIHVYIKQNNENRSTLIGHIDDISINITIPNELDGYFIYSSTN